MKRSIIILLLTSIFILPIHAHIRTVWVGMDGLTFAPSTMNVAVGDTVRFSWVAGAHTTTSVSIPTGASTWSSNISNSLTQFDYVVTELGQYNYRCNPHGSLGMTGSFTATVTGVEDQLKAIKSSLSVSPNPVVDQTTLKFLADRSFHGEVRLYNAAGHMVYTDKFRVESGENTHIIHTSRLQTGIYYLNLIDKEGSFLVEKLIKH